MQSLFLITKSKQFCRRMAQQTCRVPCFQTKPVSRFFLSSLSLHISFVILWRYVLYSIPHPTLCPPSSIFNCDVQGRHLLNSSPGDNAAIVNSSQDDKAAILNSSQGGKVVILNLSQGDKVAILTIQFCSRVTKPQSWIRTNVTKPPSWILSASLYYFGMFFTCN